MTPEIAALDKEISEKLNEAEQLGEAGEVTDELQKTRMDTHVDV